MSYSITFHDSAADLPTRELVETQYRAALERELGGAEGVLAAWRAWQHAEHDYGMLSDETWKMARRWVIASDLARRTTLGQADDGNVYFEVQKNSD